MTFHGGGGCKCQVFEGDLTDENPINLATSVLLYKTIYVVCVELVSQPDLLLKPILSDSVYFECRFFVLDVRNLSGFLPITVQIIRNMYAVRCVEIN